MRLFRTALISLILLIVGCANPFSQYFEYAPQMKGAKHTSEIPIFEKNQDDPLVYSTNNFDRDIKEFMRKGYFVIGHSSFNGANINLEDAKIQANKIGASVILVNTKFTHTLSGAIPIVTPNPPQNINRYQQGTVYTGGKYGTYSGYTTGQVSGGSQTNWVPYNVNRFDCDAIYLAKTKKVRMGILTSRLNDEIRGRMDKTQGLVVQIVINDSPAYFANILEGDVILELNGHKIFNDNDLSSAINETPRSADINVVIWRNGQIKNLTVRPRI